jgi:hypothetical protein
MPLARHGRRTRRPARPGSPSWPRQSHRPAAKDARRSGSVRAGACAPANGRRRDNLAHRRSPSGANPAHSGPRIPQRLPTVRAGGETSSSKPDEQHGLVARPRRDCGGYLHLARRRERTVCGADTRFNGVAALINAASTKPLASRPKKRRALARPEQAPATPPWQTSSSMSYESDSAASSSSTRRLDLDLGGSRRLVRQP